MGLETELIVKYFGSVGKPLAMQAMRSLPHANATIGTAINRALSE
jgi:hypothetical protein